jgi:putative transposase
MGFCMLRPMRCARRSACPQRQIREVAAMRKAIHAQESREAALAKAEAVSNSLGAMKL